MRGYSAEGQRRRQGRHGAHLRPRFRCPQTGRSSGSSWWPTRTSSSLAERLSTHMSLACEVQRVTMELLMIYQDTHVSGWACKPRQD